MEAEPRQQLIDARARVKVLEDELWEEQAGRAEVEEEVRYLRGKLSRVRAELDS